MKLNQLLNESNQEQQIEDSKFLPEIKNYLQKVVKELATTGTKLKSFKAESNNSTSAGNNYDVKMLFSNGFTNFAIWIEQQTYDDEDSEDFAFNCKLGINISENILHNSMNYKSRINQFLINDSFSPSFDGTKEECLEKIEKFLNGTETYDVLGYPLTFIDEFSKWYLDISAEIADAKLIIKWDSVKDETLILPHVSGLKVRTEYPEADEIQRM